MQIPSAQLSGLKQIIYSCEPFSYSREWPPDNNSFGIWCEVLRSAAIQKKIAMIPMCLRLEQKLKSILMFCRFKSKSCLFNYPDGFCKCLNIFRYIGINIQREIFVEQISLSQVKQGETDVTFNIYTGYFFLKNVNT